MYIRAGWESGVSWLVGFFVALGRPRLRELFARWKIWQGAQRQPTEEYRAFSTDRMNATRAREVRPCQKQRRQGMLRSVWQSPGNSCAG